MKLDLFHTEPVSVPVWILVPWIAATVIVAILVLIMWLPVLSAQAGDRSHGIATSPHGQT